MAHKTTKEFNARFTELKNIQQPHIGPWKDLRDYQAPNRGNFEEDRKKHGQRKDLKIYNGTPALSARTFGAGMNSNNTSKARPWFKLAITNRELMERADVKLYLHKVQDILYQIFNRSNFYTQAASLYLEIGVFGTACMSIESDFDDIVRFETYTIGEYFIAENDKGKIDVVYRRFHRTPSQLIAKFGEENVSENVKTLSKSKPDETIEIIHAVEPNDDRVIGIPTSANKAYRSVYYEKESVEDKFLKVSGFDEFPYMVVRWSTVGGDPYGTDQPGIIALGDAKQLQTGAVKKSKGLDRNLNPPLQAPSNMKSGRIMNVPGGVSFYNEFASNGPGVKPMYEVRVPLSDINEDNRNLEQRIRNAYFVDLFLTISGNDRPQDMKAEVAFQMDKERLLMLGPLMNSLDDDWLDPLIDKVFQFAQDAHALPDPPDDLDGVDLKVEYVSALAKAQKSGAISNMERLSGLVGAWANFHPPVADKLDFDQGVDEAGDILDVPPRFIRSDEDVKVVRDAKKDIQNRQVALEAGVAAAGAAKDLASAPVGTGNALEQLVGAGK